MGRGLSPARLCCGGFELLAPPFLETQAACSHQMAPKGVIRHGKALDMRGDSRAFESIGAILERLPNGTGAKT